MLVLDRGHRVLLDCKTGAMEQSNYVTQSRGLLIWVAKIRLGYNCDPERRHIKTFQVAFQCFEDPIRKLVFCVGVVLWG